MKTKSIKIVLTFIVTLFFGVTVFAQQFKAHAVKQGETLETISTKYRVAIDDILTYNKEIRKGQKLTVSTILIIPLDKKIPDGVAIGTKSDSIQSVENTKPVQKKPIRFISHKTKRRENLYRLSKTYNITEDDIKRYNKVLYSEQLKKGMRLRIPVFKKENTANVVAISNQNTIGSKDSTTIKSPEPYNFSKYRVKKREDLDDIAKKFSVTPEQIKKYNRKLYSARVKKGMNLQIPHYKIETVEDKFANFILKSYEVKPKETRWSIAHKFGITVDSLLFFNPELPKTTDYLGIGHVLKVPEGLKEIKGEPQTVVLEETVYIDYKVPAKMTYYSIYANYGVTETELKRVNPAVAERGLQEGMDIKLPQKQAGKIETTINTEINAENYIFYIVKQGQGQMALVRELKVPFSKILEYNPDLENGIKKGMVLKLPKVNEGELNIKNSLIIPKVNLLDSINVMNRPIVFVMLPFGLDKVDISNKSAVKKNIKESKIKQYSLGLYSGMLIAADYIKQFGVSVHLKTIDTQRNLSRVRNILSLESLNGVNAIVGPIDAASLREVAQKAKMFNTPVVSPTSSSGISMEDNVFYSVPRDEVLRKKMLDYNLTQYNEENIVVIADIASKTASDDIMKRFPKAKVMGLINDLTIDIEHFEKLLEKGDNWVFVETRTLKVAKSAISLVNSFNTEDFSIRMFTTNANRAFDRNSMDITVLSSLNFTYPSTNKELTDRKFVSLYKNKFGKAPDRFAVRGFDLMYDLLLKLSYKNNLFDVSKLVGQTEYTANKFNYQHEPGKGYYNSSSYIMKYEKLRVVEVDTQK